MRAFPVRAIIWLLLWAVVPSLQGAPVQEPAQALRELGIRYEHGEGVVPDHRRAYRLYCIAAALGDGDAAYNLGWMYVNGRGVPRDDARAASWFQRAASASDPHAQRMLQHLGAVTPRHDPTCPIPGSGRAPARQHIETWVQLLAPEFGVDPELVLAVVAAESNFNARARSSKNARGLMQLIPTTARRFGVEDVWHPVMNLRGGVAYLSWLLRTFQGDVRLALAAYNAGEDAVRHYGGVPPYPETRLYVRRILGDYRKSEHPVPPRADLLAMRQP